MRCIRTMMAFGLATALIAGCIGMGLPAGCLAFVLGAALGFVLEVA